MQQENMHLLVSLLLLQSPHPLRSRSACLAVNPNSCPNATLLSVVSSLPPALAPYFCPRCSYCFLLLCLGLSLSLRASSTSALMIYYAQSISVTNQQGEEEKITKQWAKYR
jgi:hypothetical protein